MPSRYLCYLILPLLLGTMSYGCSSEPDAQSVIDKAIAQHGGERYKRAKIEFTFRDRDYTMLHDDGIFVYTRHYSDSMGTIHDTLSNEGFKRYVDNRSVELSAADSSSYANSLNSVIYFALLPYGLNDPPVRKQYLGTDTVKSEPYHEIHISFRQEGGGKDYEDTFVYWIHQEDYTMDYLAYHFHVDGGGIRFRDGVNERLVKGIRILDYDNYKGVMGVPLHKQDSLFMNNELEMISEIDLENIEVTLLDR